MPERRTRHRRHSGHLDEIAGLLAKAYVRLRQKQATLHTSGADSLDARAVSLDSNCLAEHSLAGHNSLLKEKVHDHHV